MRRAIFIILVFGVMSCAVPKKEGTETTQTGKTTTQKTTSKTTTTSKSGGTAEAKEEHMVLCKQNTDERKLANRALKDGGCEVVYSKFGQSTSVATSQNGTEHCQRIVEKMKGNLTASGFQCSE
jgi:hypothetical protein